MRNALSDVWEVTLTTVDDAAAPAKTPSAADQTILIEYIKTLNATVESQTRLVFDATKYNYTAFGAIFLLSNTSLFASNVPIRDVLFVCCIISCSISIACALFVQNRGVYANFSRKKRSIAERTLYRGRDFAYFQKKWNEEYRDVEKPSGFSLKELLSSSQPMKSINLLPFVFSLVITLNGFLNLPQTTHAPINH